MTITIIFAVIILILILLALNKGKGKENQVILKSNSNHQNNMSIIKNYDNLIKKTEELRKKK